MESIVQLITTIGTRGAKKSVELHARHWESIAREGCVGRWVPDTEKPAEVPVDFKYTFEEWMRLVTTQTVMLEINTQLGDMSLKRHPVQLLDHSIATNADFESIFLPITTDRHYQCAEVMNTTHRQWSRLVGRRHDVMLWDADEREIICSLSRKYKVCLRLMCYWTIIDIRTHSVWYRLQFQTLF
jgi:hypothetical protein